VLAGATEVLLRTLYVDHECVVLLEAPLAAYVPMMVDPDANEPDPEPLTEAEQALLRKYIEDLRAKFGVVVDGNPETGNYTVRMPGGQQYHHRTVSDTAHVTDTATVEVIPAAVAAAAAVPTPGIGTKPTEIVGSVDPEQVRGVLHVFSRFPELAAFVAGQITAGPLGELGNWSWDQVLQVAQHAIELLHRR
jgi:hypothetical protein